MKKAAEKATEMTKSLEEHENVNSASADADVLYHNIP